MICLVDNGGLRWSGYNIFNTEGKWRITHGLYQKWFWRIEVIRPIGLHVLYPYPVLLYILQGQCLGQWTLFIAPCMQGDGPQIRNTCVHTCHLHTMVVAIVLALLLRDIGGLRLCVGKWAEVVGFTTEGYWRIEVMCRQVGRDSWVYYWGILEDWGYV